ncbi:MAG: c(7)-type cytochrome triheme domain-containing protein, partial [Alphaproteobacteria bacterium]
LLITVFFVGAALAVEGDIVFKRLGGEGGTPAATFPHWFHRIRYKCYACHPTPFEMKAGANKITMDTIQEGKFCGVCHNGKTAWEVSFNTCPRCHAEK